MSGQKITLSSINPYALSRRFQQDIGNNTELRRIPQPYKKTNRDFLYKIRQSDTLDAITALFFGNIVADYARHTWKIVDANPTLITNPLDISTLVGQKIIIPDVDAETWLL